MKTTREKSSCLYGFKEHTINITLFFGLIFSVLMTIFVFFKPLSIQERDFVDVPLFQVITFDIYELNKEGLKTILSGSSSNRYSDRYTVKDMDYTDNSKEYIASMQSNEGVYKGDVVELHGDVNYAREDGLSMKTDHAIYDKNETTVFTDSNFVAYRNNNVVTGTSIKYNNATNKIESKNVVVKYQLKER